MDRFSLHDQDSGTQVYASSSIKETYDLVDNMLRQDGLAGLDGLILYDTQHVGSPLRSISIAVHLHDLHDTREPLDAASA